jgi:hypothetical protein
MSKIEVNKIGPQCGTTLTVGCGAGQTVAVDANTVTIGRCGGTVALASGASQTGFGRTGTVDWQTGSIKTATFTAVSGQGFFCDTNGGGFTCNLPAGSAGAIVSLQDYRNTFDTSPLAVVPNGSEKINGGQGAVTLGTEGEGITLVYIDSTVGWRSIQDNDFAAIGSNFVAATGGTVTESGDCKIHTFTSPGTFTVTAAGSGCNSQLSYLIVGGGGGGGFPNAGAGGGAGGFREVKTPVSPYTASPLDGFGTPGNRVSALNQAYPIVVGAGGTTLANGSDSSGLGITSAGGGAGAKNSDSPYAGRDGGSGGGGMGNGGSNCQPGGTGNTPPVTPAQGTNGGSNGGGGPGAQGDVGGGGGGATEVGQNGSPGPLTGGRGGAGTTTSITASPVAYAGGGGAGGRPGNGGTPGAASPCGTGGAGAAAGTTNRGGGGGGGVHPSTPNGNGGSGIVIIRYKFQ